MPISGYELREAANAKPNVTMPLQCIQDQRLLGAIKPAVDERCVIRQLQRELAGPHVGHAHLSNHFDNILMAGAVPVGKPCPCLCGVWRLCQSPVPADVEHFIGTQGTSEVGKQRNHVCRQCVGQQIVPRGRSDRRVDQVNGLSELTAIEIILRVAQSAANGNGSRSRSHVVKHQAEPFFESPRQPLPRRELAAPEFLGTFENKSAVGDQLRRVLDVECMVVKPPAVETKGRQFSGAWLVHGLLSRRAKTSHWSVARMHSSDSLAGAGQGKTWPDRHRRAGQIVRVIDYTLQDSATPVQDSYRLVTNILNPADAPALELAALYHERWEIEGVFDEFKTHLRANNTVLRSKTPDLVLQELWGLLLAHFAIRQLMAQAAWPRGLDPDRLSFTHSVRVIKRKMPQAAAVPP